MSSLSGFLEKSPIAQEISNPLIEVHIVDRNDLLYAKGRTLAKQVYRQVWETENLIDNNDYGIVISTQGSVIGNINVQIRKANSLLKSEVFFGQEHWHHYFQTDPTAVAEISGLAIAEDLASDLRRPVMMLLIFGMYMLYRPLGVKYAVTIQHKFLMRILTKSLFLNFFRNEIITSPQEEKIPDDCYWNRAEPPQLYYIASDTLEVAESCYSFFFYLNMIGLRTTFFPRALKTSNLSYASFWESFQQDKGFSAYPEIKFG
jgi:hypothetical protein